MNIDGNFTEGDDYIIPLNLQKVCELVLETEPQPPDGYCTRSWDGLLCWPNSPPGVTAYLPCIAELHGIKYDSTQNVSRFCHENGTWAILSNYSACLEVQQATSDEGVIVQTMIYCIGYGLSLVALCIAVWIFLYYKDLKCLRNVIHTNLMCTYILADFMWILNYALQLHVQTDTASCILLDILLHYLLLTNYFWMFVEGLYLYMLVVETFTRENIKLRTYLIIGWGIPLIVIIAWGVARAVVPNEYEHIPSGDHKECSWIAPSTVDWIHHGSAILVLTVNVIFLIKIMWVLITKLRSSNNVETQQYRKATKALLVLIPLLGVTFMLFLVGPTEGTYANIFAYIRAFLLSTQGLMVALFYCFLNTEVRNTVRHHIHRWKESRNLGARRYTSNSKDWSPNTRTESIRLYSKHEITPYKKRESTASDNTTMTLVGGIPAQNSRLSNGSARAPVSPFLELPRDNNAL